MQPSSSDQSPPPPPRAAKSSTLQNLLRLIAEITVDDISGAEPCGGGGFGDVYVMTHAAIGKLALKRVRISGNQQEIDTQLRRAAREGETWRGLDHPNILPFFDVLERSGCIYLVSPFVQNGSITDFVRKHPDIDRAQLIQEAAAGIAYIHRCGIVHGDIKGANILVSDDIRSLLCDFGLAREQQNKTSTEMQGIGTIRWQSTELLASGAGRSFKSDVWAFAMTIYEILSGRIPYHDCDSITAVVIAIFVLKQRPPKEPATSPTGASYGLLWDVATECWHDDPDQRPEMREVYDRLIIGSFRSLLLSLSPKDEDDTRNATQITYSPYPLSYPRPSDASRPIPASPVTSTLSQAQAHINSGPMEHRISPEEDKTMMVGGQKRTIELQTNIIKHDENTTTALARPPRLPTQHVLGNHGRQVFAVGFSPDGKTIASGSRNHTLQLWDVGARDKRGRSLKGHKSAVSCLAFSPDGTTIASGSWDSKVELWDIKTRDRIGLSFSGHTDSIRCLAFSPDGTSIVTGSDDKSVRLWNVETRNRRGKSLKDHTDQVACVAFSPDGTTFASGSFDNTLRLWDVKARRPRGQPLLGHTSHVYCLAFSPDGTTIASGSNDDTIRLWNVEDGSQRGQPFVGHTSSLCCLAFSPDGTTIASGSRDATIRLWNVQSGSQRGGSFEGYGGAVEALSFSPDGLTIVSGFQNGSVVLWVL